MRRIPVRLAHDDLVILLADILERVRSGDCLEGNISWELPGDPRDERAEEGGLVLDVTGAYRTGNLHGQGGMRLIGNWEQE